MADFVIINGDQVLFQPSFTPAVVTVMPGVMTGSGPSTFSSQMICVEGDEKNVQIPGCAYVTPVYSVPGVGMLLIDSLAPNQQAQKTNSGHKKMILKGGNFIAKFQVMTPAQMPPPASTPDSTPAYMGQGSFITSNTKYKAT